MRLLNRSEVNDSSLNIPIRDICLCLLFFFTLTFLLVFFTAKKLFEVKKPVIIFSCFFVSHIVSCYCELLVAM